MFCAYWMPYALLMVCRPTGRVRSDAVVRGDERPQEVVPGPDEHEDRDGGQDGPGQRQDDLGEDPQAAGTVHHGGFLEFAGNLVEELLEHEHHGRVDDLRQDDGPRGIDQVQRQHLVEERDDEDRRRNDDRGNDHRHQHLLALEVDPGQGVGHQRRDHQRDRRDGRRGVQRVPGPERDVAVLEHLDERFGGKARRRQPADLRRGGVRLGLESGGRGPGEGNQPQHGDECCNGDRGDPACCHSLAGLADLEAFGGAGAGSGTGEGRGCHGYALLRRVMTNCMTETATISPKKM